jgi:RNA polymerase sigma-70 factor (ECF subfamily)
MAKATDTAALVRAAKDGDREAQGALLARYEPQVRRIVALNMGRTLAAAVEDEDLVQETMLEILQGLPHLTYHNEAGLVAWMARVAESRIRSLARRMSRQKRDRARERLFGQSGSVLRPQPFLVSPSKTPSQCAQANEFDRILDQALVTLPPRDRRVVILRQIVGLSHAEVARELGLTEVGTRTIFARSLARIGASLPEGLALQA